MKARAAASIAQIIREAREALEPAMSQSAVARALGVSRAAVSYWEAGNTEPDRDKIVPLANLLGIDPASLLSGTAIPKPRPPGKVAPMDDQERARGLARLAHQKLQEIERILEVSPYMQGAGPGAKLRFYQNLLNMVQTKHTAELEALVKKTKR